MIVSKNVNPERSLYYLGGKVIEALNLIDEQEVDYIELFHMLNISETVSLKLYTLVLDWLFIIGVINKGKKGLIVKCF